MLATLVEELEALGVAPEQMDVIIGGGTHRMLSRTEIEQAFGPQLCRKLRIVNHDCHAPDLVSGGTLPRSGEVLLNRTFMEADLRIAVGSILPHPWNGFGGGAKLILPGIAGWDTIKRHHLALVTAKGVTFGNLADNPFHDEVYQAGKMSGVDMIVNAVYNANEDVKGVVAGHFEEAYRHGARLCEQEMGVRFEEAADVTIASVFPYCDAPQTMKPLGPATLVTKKGGTVILYVDELEQRCYPETMRAGFSKALALAKGDPRAWCLITWAGRTHRARGAHGQQFGYQHHTALPQQGQGVAGEQGLRRRAGGAAGLRVLGIPGRGGGPCRRREACGYGEHPAGGRPGAAAAG
jgi:nickel-dependent lactate racemase